MTSVAGTRADDIWFAGADPRDGSGPLILHYDGQRLERVLSDLESSSSVDLWWVRAFTPEQVFFAGSQGTIVKYDGTSFTRLSTPGTGTVFGLWGTSPETLWAVGGDPSGAGSAFVWRRVAGGGFETAPGVPELGLAAYFKVWGRSADDLRIVGADGIVLSYDGTRFSEEASGTLDTLTTVHASSSGDYVAVGGFGRGVILENLGSGWQDRTPVPGPPQLSGVWLLGSQGYAVGANGAIWSRSAGGWQEDSGPGQVTLDLHAVFVSPNADVWAVGGDLFSTPKLNGLILYRGPNLPGLGQP